VDARPRRAERVDRYQRRHTWLGFPIAVVYKAFDDRALFLAALVTYYAFVALFPLLLIFVSTLGFVLQSHPEIRQDILNSAVGQIPGIGTTLKQNISGFKGSAAGLAVGGVGLIYGALGATQSAQAAFNHIYAVPRNLQPNPIRSRLRSLGLLFLLGTAVVVSSGINFLVSNSNGISHQLGLGLKIVGYLVDLVINVGLFSVAFRVLTATELHLRDVFAGGLITGAGWELLQAFGSRYVLHEVQHGSALYGVFGVVLATLAWIYLVALVIMVSAEINVVRGRKLWPRSLMSPFTDNIDPTPADLVVYESYVRSHRFKGWLGIDVSFNPPEPRGGEPRAAPD
jgi:YihY family inner membrane protein